MHTNTNTALKWGFTLLTVLAACFLVASLVAPASVAFANNSNHDQEEHDNNGHNDGDHNGDEHEDNGNGHNDGDDEDEGGSTLEQLCTNGIDDDNDGLTDLLDPECAAFIPVCTETQHPNEFLQCVDDPTCGLGQHIENHACVNDPTTATVVATKVVCDNETDLPNWGTGSADITSTTATDYVAAHTGCHVQSGWTFEYAADPVTNPGDNMLAGGAGWTAFGPTNVLGIATAQVLAGVKTWVREQLQSGYIPFTFNTNEGSNVDPVSAELYCHTDVLNYDNFDWINPVTVGETYYCVAFNAPVEVEEPTTGSITIVKNTVENDGVFTFTPNYEGGTFTLSNGQEHTTDNLATGVYSVSEAQLSANWTQQSATCSDGSPVTAIDLSAGEHVTCTFTNVFNFLFDMCSNLDGVQTTVPNGYHEGEAGQCVADEVSNENESNGGNGGSGDPAPTVFLGGGPITGGGILGSGNGGGQVLGESCGLYMNKYLRLGKKNDVEQVKKLQTFLNKKGFGPIPVTGFYGPMTVAAVNAFQAKYSDDVLKPWSINGPTGIVYQTTLRRINLLECPALTLALPALVEWSKNHEVPN